MTRTDRIRFQMKFSFPVGSESLNLDFKLDKSYSITFISCLILLKISYIRFHKEALNKKIKKLLRTLAFLSTFVYFHVDFAANSE